MCFEMSIVIEFLIQTVKQRVDFLSSVIIVYLSACCWHAKTETQNYW